VTGEPDGRERDGGPRRPGDLLAQQHSGEERRQDDVRAGDEAGDGRRRRCKPLGLRDLGQPVERPQPHADRHLATVERSHRPPERDEHDGGGDREAHGEEVDGWEGLHQVVDEEERRAPDRGQGDEQERGEAGLRWGLHGASQTIVRMIVEPLGAC
jgi:hypothetical protein